MEKSSQPSFLKSLALAFGDGLLFGVAMKLAQGPSKTREDEMTDLGPLAERLRKVDDHTQTIDKEALMQFGEGLDGRVLEKVIVALEARLTEHVGHVDRRLAEIDAQVALDLKAVDTHTAAQTNAVEKAIQEVEAQVRDYVAAAQQSSDAQIAEVDQKLSALHEGLPAKFREIVEAVRQSMEARVALELTELENRVSSRNVAPEQLQELQSSLRGEVEALSGRLSAEMRGLAENQQSQTAPLQQALLQLETKLTTLREELPPKIRQIVEAVEASMDARVSAGDQQAADRAAALEQALAALRAEMPSAGGFRQAVDESLRSHAEHVGALDQKLTALQEELPPKIKAIVDAVRESLDARMAVELQGIEERHAAQLQESAAKVQADLAGMHAQFQASGSQVSDRLAGLEQHAAQITAGMASELESLRTEHRTEIEQVEARLRAERVAENVPGQVDSAVGGLRQSLEAKLAAEIHDLEARAGQITAGIASELESLQTGHRAEIEQLETRLRAERAAENLPGQIDSAVGGLRQSLEAKLAAEIHDLEAHASQITAGMASELESLQTGHRAEIEQLETRLRAERAAENLPGQVDSAVGGLRQSLEAKLAAEIHDLEARATQRDPGLEKALQYASLLEARVQALEQKLQQSAEETVDRAVERVWQALESRLQQRQAQAPPPVQPPEIISGLRQKSTSAEQSVLDLIAGIGQLFEKPAPRAVPEAAHVRTGTGRRDTRRTGASPAGAGRTGICRGRIHPACAGHPRTGGPR